MKKITKQHIKDRIKLSKIVDGLTLIVSSYDNEKYISISLKPEDLPDLLTGKEILSTVLETRNENDW